MNRAALFATLLGACIFSQGAHALTPAEYKANRSRVQNAYATAKERCTSVQGSRRVCEAEARRTYDIERAELLAHYRPTPRNKEKAHRMKADGDFRVATEKCGDLTASAKTLCLDEAKTKWHAAKTDALAERAEDRKQVRLDKGKSP